MEKTKLQQYINSSDMSKGQAMLASRSVEYAELAESFEKFAAALTGYATTIRQASSELESLIDDVDMTNGVTASSIATDAKNIYDNLTGTQPQYMYPKYIDRSIERLAEEISKIVPNEEYGCSSFTHVAKLRLGGNLPLVEDAQSDDEYF
jgi:hypothetical protein